METYTVSTERGIVTITGNTSGYTLDLVQNRFPLRFLHYSFHSNIGSGLYITARSMDEYDVDIRLHTPYPSLQYVEVGAGLGEFTPGLVKRFGVRLRYRPILIDPANYKAMQGILRFAQGLPLSHQMVIQLCYMAQRCDTILDSKKVKLVNLTLDEAVNQDPELLGVADVVVDNVGASHYMANHEEAWGLEKRLLKPDGVLFSEIVKSGIVISRPDTIPTSH